MFAPPAGGGAFAATPVSVDTMTFDASDDGRVLLVGGYQRIGGENIWFLVRSEGAAWEHAASTVLTSTFEGRPVLSPDGSTAWWIDRGFVFTHRGGTTTRSPTPLFAAPTTAYRPVGFDVSPDGTYGAAMYARYDSAGKTVASKVVARRLDGSAGDTVDRYWSTTSAPVLAVPTTFSWADATTLLYGTRREGVLGYEATSPSPDGGTPARRGADGRYLVQPFDGGFWSWADVDGVTSYGTSSDPLAAPTTSSDRVDGRTTTDYLPISGGAVIMDRPTNPMRTYAYLYPRWTDVLVDDTVPYLAWAGYVGPTPGATLADDGLSTSWGSLEQSYDGLHWKTVDHSSATRGIRWPGSATRRASGSTQQLQRSVFLRWRYAGSWYTQPSTSVVRRVTVHPKSRKLFHDWAYHGTRLTLHGSFTRVGGVAVLYRLSGNGHRTRLKSVRMGDVGNYTFALYRPRGTYEIVSLADSGWGDARYRLRVL
ncbi:hypothetical protein GCM10027446_20790 [Angustibacter peucedani]